MLKDELLKIDDSTIDKGVITVGITTSLSKKIKIQVKKNDIILYYDLTTPTIQIPLQFGSGSYAISLFQNIRGKSYEKKGTLHITLNKDATENYLLESNQYVECYHVKNLAASLTKNTDNDYDKYIKIKKYIKSNYHYNYLRAFTIAKGTLPDIQYCLKHKSGICQDLSALAAALLRNNNIPTRFVVGYADKKYHAWLEVRAKGKRIIYDPTADCQNKKIKNYVEERWY